MHEASTRRRLSKAQQQHGRTNTPSGTVIQRMPLPIGEEKPMQWLYAHPVALIHHMCSLSACFRGVMADVAVEGQPLGIIIYIDEICPGNPLRPEKSRTLQAIYWCFKDWPDWLLARTAA